MQRLPNCIVFSSSSRGTVSRMQVGGDLRAIAEAVCRVQRCDQSPPLFRPDLCSAQCTNRVLARIRLSGIRSRFIYSLLHTDRIWSWRNCSAVIIASQRFAKFILGREQFRPRPQAREAPRVLTEWSLREEATKSAANDLAYSV